ADISAQALNWRDAIGLSKGQAIYSTLYNNAISNNDIVYAYERNGIGIPKKRIKYRYKTESGSEKGCAIYLNNRISYKILHMRITSPLKYYIESKKQVTYGVRRIDY